MMATRGAKPKPAALRLIDGTHNVTRHGAVGDAKAMADTASQSFGPLVRPSRLKAAARKVWDEMIAPAGWLDGSRMMAALAFCELAAEWHESPKMFPAAKHGQMRAYMAELGLTDERNRKVVEPDARDEFDD